MGGKRLGAKSATFFDTLITIKGNGAPQALWGLQRGALFVLKLTTKELEHILFPWEFSKEARG